MPVVTLDAPVVNAPPLPSGIGIALREASMRFPSGLQALDNIDAAVAPGEFVAIVGPSGCGKSTLLRIVAGLITPTGGTCARSGDGAAAFVFQEPHGTRCRGAEARRPRGLRTRLSAQLVRRNANAPLARARDCAEAAVALAR